MRNPKVMQPAVPVLCWATWLQKNFQGSGP